MKNVSAAWKKKRKQLAFMEWLSSISSHQRSHTTEVKYTTREGGTGVLQNRTHHGIDEDEDKRPATLSRDARWSALIFQQNRGQSIQLHGHGLQEVLRMWSTQIYNRKRSVVEGYTPCVNGYLNHKYTVLFF